MEDLQEAEFERRNVIFRDELASRLNILTNFIDDVKASKRAGEREVPRRCLSTPGVEHPVGLSSPLHNPSHPFPLGVQKVEEWV